MFEHCPQGSPASRPNRSDQEKKAQCPQGEAQQVPARLIWNVLTAVSRRGFENSMFASSCSMALLSNQTPTIPPKCSPPADCPAVQLTALRSPGSW